ncbi:MAG: hypothetical protein AMJ88_07015 [Anaerolineae bacterium SM23_ 63]|nr:MAG: hypothetical protein AMJ88_07015 [Anaerolineae bacterium SM23_ 63]
MNQMIAFCGIDCHECGVLIATRENDDAKRREVAELWSNEFNADIQPQDINCVGCLSKGGVLFSHCYECEIRKCGMEKGIANCAYCTDYACNKLEGLLSMVQDAKTRLDKIRAAM